MDTSRISFGEMIAAVGGLVLFVVMFFPWYKAEAEFGGVSASETGNAWEVFSFIDILLLLVVLIALGVAVARASGAMPAMPAPPGAIVAGAGALAVLLVLFRLISAPSPDVEGVDVGRQIGVFLGLLAAAAIAFGGYTAMNERGSGQAPPA